MPEYILTATPYGKKSFALQLTDDFNQDSVDENNFWLCDLTYRFKLNLYGVEKVSLSVNGNFVKDFFSGEEISCGRIFLDCYGYARLDFAIEFKGGKIFNLHSDYLAVFVRKNSFNDSVKAMINFIYENCAELLFDGDLYSRAPIGYRAKNLDDRLKLAENIAAIYEKNSSYFKTNCRFKTEKIPALDNFEKLQAVTPAALQFIAAHPENLSPSQNNFGIKIGKRIFQPQKILTLKNIHSRDIYENRVVLWFLSKILDDLASLNAEYERRAQNFRSDGDYQNSAQFLFHWAESARQKIFSLQEKFQRLQKIYSDALQIPQPDFFSVPQPTQIFLSVPQYRQIFLKIQQWLKLPPYGFARENFMLSLVKNWSLYEKYLLLKFIDYLRNFRNFIQLNKFHINYPIEKTSCLRLPKFFNTFIFSDGKTQITLYYQPVIYNSLQKAFGAPNLYRNNSHFGGGNYYVPDFIIKFENRLEPARFIILDAKFSDEYRARKNNLQEFILKYIFSISAANPDEKISGYRLVYAKCADTAEVKNIFDNQLSGKNISPSFKIVPLMENLRAKNLSLHEIFNPM